MGRIKKKAEEGNVTKYIGRNGALKRLQLSLTAFRRLCILKGIYPREPPTNVKKAKGQNKTYYLMKDIKYLMHDPIIETVREEKSQLKKIAKAKGRSEFKEMRRLIRQKPKIKFDHIIKERYPTFPDALRDLDDALSMVAVFAQLPSESGLRGARTDRCSRLLAEWQFYISQTHSLEKAFVSVKGVYLQASVMGHPVTWLIPYRFTTKFPPPNVDVKIMFSFLDFYEVLMGFVHYKLFQDLGMQYPPKKASLFARTLRVPEEKKLKEEDVSARGKLFSKFHFFLGRETPSFVLRFLIESMGGRVTEEEQTDPEVLNRTNIPADLSEQLKAREADASITHHITDRPPAALKNKHENRDYVQPQWVFDCLNAGVVLPIAEYIPGATLPPHLSPFVDNEAEGYVPERAQQLRQLIAQLAPQNSDANDATNAEAKAAGELPVEDVQDEDAQNAKLSALEEQYQNDLYEETGVKAPKKKEKKEEPKKYFVSTKANAVQSVVQKKQKTGETEAKQTKTEKQQLKKGTSASIAAASASTSDSKKRKQQLIVEEEQEEDVDGEEDVDEDDVDADDGFDNSDEEDGDENGADDGASASDEQESDEEEGYEPIVRPARTLNASQQAREAQDLRAIMLPKKKRRLYQRIQYTHRKTAQKNAQLAEKREKVKLAKETGKPLPLVNPAVPKDKTKKTAKPQQKQSTDKTHAQSSTSKSSHSAKAKHPKPAHETSAPAKKRK